jgi:hypothetical protein
MRHDQLFVEGYDRRYGISFESEEGGTPVAEIGQKDHTISETIFQLFSEKSFVLESSNQLSSFEDAMRGLSNFFQYSPMRTVSMFKVTNCPRAHFFD